MTRLTHHSDDGRATRRGRRRRALLATVLAIASLAALGPAGRAGASVLPSNCTMTWTGPTQGDWNDPGVWSSNDSSVVCIPSGFTVIVRTLDGANRAMVAAGALFVDDHAMLDVSDLAGLTLAGPTVSKIGGTLLLAGTSGDYVNGSGVNLLGAGTLEIVAGGSLVWGKGQLSGTGQIVIDAGGSATIYPHSTVLSKPIVNHGTLSIVSEVSEAAHNTVTYTAGASLSSDGQLVLDTTAADLNVGGGSGAYPGDVAGTVSVIGGGTAEL